MARRLGRFSGTDGCPRHILSPFRLLLAVVGGSSYTPAVTFGPARGGTFGIMSNTINFFLLIDFDHEISGSLLVDFVCAFAGCR